MIKMYEYIKVSKMIHFVYHLYKLTLQAMDALAQVNTKFPCNTATLNHNNKFSSNV